MLQLLGNVVKRSTTLPPKQLQQHQEYGKKWDVEVLWCKRKAPAAAAHSEALSHSQGRDVKVLEDRGGSNSGPIPAREGGGELQPNPNGHSSRERCRQRDHWWTISQIGKGEEKHLQLMLQ